MGQMGRREGVLAHRCLAGQGSREKGNSWWGRVVRSALASTHTFTFKLLWQGSRDRRESFPHLALEIADPVWQGSSVRSSPVSLPRIW